MGLRSAGSLVVFHDLVFLVFGFSFSIFVISIRSTKNHSYGTYSNEMWFIFGNVEFIYFLPPHILDFPLAFIMA
jgi:hypothetical protein